MSTEDSRNFWMMSKVTDESKSEVCRHCKAGLVPAESLLCVFWINDAFHVPTSGHQGCSSCSSPTPQLVLFQLPLSTSKTVTLSTLLYQTKCKLSHRIVVLEKI